MFHLEPTPISLKVINEDGFEYLAGWIAHNHSNEFPILGQYNSKFKPSDHNYVIPDWIQQEAWLSQTLAL